MTTIAIFGLMTVTIAQVPSYVPKSGLVGWWPFNGNANDETGNGLNCTLINNPNLSSDRFGKSNSAYFLNGTNNWIQEDSSFLQVDKPHSIAMWFITTDSIKTNQTLFNTSPHPIENFAFHYSSSSTPPYGLAFGIGTGSSWNIMHPDNGQITTPPTESKWHHVVWTKDTSLTWRFYFDGVLIGKFISSTNIPSQLANLRFGAENNGNPTGGANFKGNLDDIGVWTRALDSSEVVGLFNAQNCKVQITQSASIIAVTGDTAKFKANTSDPNPKFQWQSDIGSGYLDLTNAGQYFGATDSVLFIKNVSKTNNKQKFRCFITTDSCSGFSIPTTLTVNCVVSQQPINSSVQVGDKAFFNIYSIDQSAQYQWQINIGSGFIDLTSAGQFKGAKNDTLEINNVSIFNNNSFFRCKVSSSKNGCSDTTSAGQLIVSCAKLVQTQPSSIIVPRGSDGNLIVTSKTTSTKYQWQINLGLGFNDVSNSGQFSGATTNSLTIKSVTLSNDNQLFRCLLQDSICLDTTNTVTLNVTWPVGFNSNENNNLIKVFPNPTSGQINIKADASLTGLAYIVYDQIGRIVLTGKLKGENTAVELSDLSCGIYLVSVGDNLKQSFKIIKSE